MVAVADTVVGVSSAIVIPLPARATIAAEVVLRRASTPCAGALTVSSQFTAFRVDRATVALPDRVAVTAVVDRAGALREPLKVQSPLDGAAIAEGATRRLAPKTTTTAIDADLIVLHVIVLKP